MIYAVVPYFRYSSPEEYVMDHDQLQQRQYFENIKQRIIALGDAYNFDYYPPICLVKYGGTIRDLSNRIGFSNEEMYTGTVFGVSLVDGWMSKSLWDWIDQNK